MLSDAIDYVEDNYIPKMNPLLANGYAYYRMRSIVNEVRCLLAQNLNRDIDPRLPKGFGFVSANILSPEKTYQMLEAKAPRSNRGTSKRRRGSDGFDISQNDIVYLECKFKVGESGNSTYSRYLGIVFSRPGNIMYIRGVKYEITPVIKARGLSVTSQGYFIDLGSNRVTFRILQRNFLANSNHVHYFIPYTQQLHSLGSQAKKSCLPPLVAWLYAKFGIQETFRLYVGAEIEFVKLNDPRLRNLDTEEWVVCQQTSRDNQHRLDYAVLIRKNQLDEKATICIGTIFYMAETLGNMMPIEYVDDAALWKRLLGRAIHPSGKSDAEIMTDIRNHLISIEVMIESGLQAELEMSHTDDMTTCGGREQIKFDTIYDFLDFALIYIIENQATRSIASLYGKYLTVNDYVTSDIRMAINRLKWELVNKARDVNKNQVGLAIPPRSIKDTLNAKMVDYLAANLTNGSHPEVSVFSTTSDNMVVSTTSKALSQMEASGGSSRKKRTIDLYDKSLHADESFAEIGSVANLTKPTPFGWAHLNMYLEVDEHGKLLRKEHLRPQQINLGNDLAFKGI